MVDQVEEIKQKTDIVSLISEHIQLKKAGRNYKALCPFHSEKTPSFMVSPELQMFKCFGCGESGDIYSFLEKYEGMEFREALKLLADRAGVKLITRNLGEASEKEKLYQINTLASKFYNYVLLGHPRGKPALDYLTKERGITFETIKTFQLGFSPDVPGVLKRFLVDKKKFTVRDLERVGLVFVQDRLVSDKFRGRIIFPLFDHRGNIAGFSGRVMPTAKSDLAKYINSPETPIYHKSNLLYGLNLSKSEIKEQKEAVFVEGELDMISSWQAGVKNTVAIKGSALTDEQVRLISRFTKKITLALDTDFAGDTAARRGISVAQKQGLEIQVARLGQYKDPDEAVRKNPPEFKKLLKETVNVWDFILDSIFSRFDLKTGEGKAKISSEVVPVLNSIPDKIVQAHYIGIVANRLKVPESAVSEQISQLKEELISEEEKKIIIPIKKIEKSRRQLLEERLLTLAFQGDPKILLASNVNGLIATPLTKRICQEYEKFSQGHKDFSPSEFTENLPKELMNGFAELVLADTGEITADTDDYKQELDLVIHDLEIVDLQHQLEESEAKIRQYEAEEEREKLKKEQEKFAELGQKLTKLKSTIEGSNRGIILQEG